MRPPAVQILISAILTTCQFIGRIINEVMQINENHIEIAQLRSELDTDCSTQCKRLSGFSDGACNQPT